MDEGHNYNKTPDYESSIMEDFKIRYPVFLIAGLCAGLPALIWAVRSLHQLQDSGVRVSVFIASLLFSDALELLLIPVILAEIFTQHEYQGTSNRFIVMFIAVRNFGLGLHQLVALDGVLSLRNPLHSSRLSSRLVSMPLTITLGIFSFIMNLYPLHLALYGLICIMGVITCVLACKASFSFPCTCTRMNQVYVAVIAMVTLAFLYGPSIAYLCTCTFTWPCTYPQLWIMSISIMSMRLIADPLVCVLACRKIPMANVSDRELPHDQVTV